MQSVRRVEIFLEIIKNVNIEKFKNVIVYDDYEIDYFIVIIIKLFSLLTNEKTQELEINVTIFNSRDRTRNRQN